MGEGDVIISDVIEEMDLLLGKKKSGGNGMHWSIAPSLVEETTVLIEAGEEINVSIGTKPVQITNLKV